MCDSFPRKFDVQPSYKLSNYVLGLIFVVKSNFLGQPIMNLSHDGAFDRRTLLFNYNPPINFRTRSLDETSRGTKPGGGYEAIPVVRFDIRRPILLTRDKQERKSLFQV